MTVAKNALRACTEIVDCSKDSEIVEVLYADAPDGYRLMVKVNDKVTHEVVFADEEDRDELKKKILLALIRGGAEDIMGTLH